MDEIITIGVDLAKSVFHLHGVDAEGRPVLRRQLRRSQMLEFFQRQPPCLIGMEACASAHYWARELTRLGHDARLMPPSYVKGYVKRGSEYPSCARAFWHPEPVSLDQRIGGFKELSKAYPFHSGKDDMLCPSHRRSWCSVPL